MVKNTSGLTTITVREHTVKLKFGLPACQAFSEMCLADDSEKYINGTKILTLGMAKLLLAAYENQCLIDDQIPVFKLGAFVEFIEDTLIDNPAEADRIMSVFSDSRYTTKLLDQVNEVIEEESKKKLIGNLSSHLHSTSLNLPKKTTTAVRSASSSSVKKGTNAMKPKKRKQKK